MFRLGIILMTICLVASLVLAATHRLTAEKIKEQETAAEKAALDDVLPQATDFKERHSDKFDYYEGAKNSKTAGYILKITAKGYSGGISMLVGIDTSGNIQGIEVLSHQETPGLGARICEKWFLEQFKGRPGQGLDMSGIQAISGATISSRAVLEAIKKDVKEFMDRI